MRNLFSRGNPSSRRTSLSDRSMVSNWSYGGGKKKEREGEQSAASQWTPSFPTPLK